MQKKRSRRSPSRGRLEIGGEEAAGTLQGSIRKVLGISEEGCREYASAFAETLSVLNRTAPACCYMHHEATLFASIMLAWASSSHLSRERAAQVYAVASEAYTHARRAGAVPSTEVARSPGDVN